MPAKVISDSTVPLKIIKTVLSWTSRDISRHRNFFFPIYSTVNSVHILCLKQLLNRNQSDPHEIKKKTIQINNMYNDTCNICYDL